MKKRMVNILNGIMDGILPTVSKSIKKTSDGYEINRARLTAAILSFMMFIAMLMGWLTFDNLASLLKMIFTISLV